MDPPATRHARFARFAITADPAQWVREFNATKQCLPRATTARDTGELAAFLLGPKAAAITGQSIFVDGGTTTQL